MPKFNVEVTLNEKIQYQHTLSVEADNAPAAKAAVDEMIERDELWDAIFKEKFVSLETDMYISKVAPAVDWHSGPAR